MIEQLFHLNEVDLVYKHNPNLPYMPTVSCSKDAHEIFRKFWDQDKIALQEQFNAIYLNTANKVLGVSNIASGGISSTIVDPKILFATALKIAASGIILAHNHPSGNLNPSKTDCKLQQKLTNGGQLLSIQVLDHLILSGIENKYHSMADNLSL